MQLGSKQIWILISAGLLVALLYFGTHITSIAAKGDATRDAAQKPQDTQAAPAELAWEDIEKASISQLSSEQQSTYAALKTQALNENDTPKKIDLLDQVVVFWKNLDKHDLAGYYLEQIGAAQPTDTMFIQAAKAYKMAASSNEESAAALTAKSIACYKRALSINDKNNDTKIQLAQAIVESGSGSPMEGIQILRDIVAQDSNHLEANIALAKFALVSGQNEKAVQRLERIEKIYPSNADILFLLADAYKGAGNTAQAKETLKKCILIVKDDSLKTALTRYMNDI